jgi:hypothetical protein
VNAVPVRLHGTSGKKKEFQLPIEYAAVAAAAAVNFLLQLLKATHFFLFPRRCRHRVSCPYTAPPQPPFRRRRSQISAAAAAAVADRPAKKKNRPRYFPESSDKETRSPGVANYCTEF